MDWRQGKVREMSGNFALPNLYEPCPHLSDSGFNTTLGVQQMLCIEKHIWSLYCIIPDDVARTLKEGRFWSQVKKMVAWKKDFTSRGVDCSLHYILEREPEDYVVQCADGCQGVGKCGNPTLRQVKV